MAVVNVKSAQITNRDASPRVFNNGGIQGGRLRRGVGSVVITNTDSIASIYRCIGEIPSNAFIQDVIIDSPDIGTTTVADIGLYRNTQDGGAVVSVALFGSAIVLNAGALARLNVTHESGTFPLASRELPLWSALGLTADPTITYDLCLTLTGAADATGTVQMTIFYT